MGLFNKSKGIDHILSLLPDEDNDIDSPVNYNSVLDYLIGLSRSDYDKLYKVSVIYRAANKEAAKVLGVKDEPTTTLKEDEPEETTDSPTIVTDPDADIFADNDDLAAAFLETGADVTPKKQPRRDTK